MTSLWPSKPAQSKPKPIIAVTHAQLYANAAHVATAFRRAGLVEGSVVASLLVNCLEFVVTFLGTTWAGAAANPLNPQYTYDELLFYLEDTKCAVVLVHIDTPPSAPIYKAAAKMGVKIWTVGLSFPRQSENAVVVTNTNDAAAASTTASTASASSSADTKQESSQQSHSHSLVAPYVVVSGPGLGSRLGLRAPHSFATQPQVRALKHTPSSDATALILHTSGTTSRPKAVPISHGNLAVSAKNIAETYRLSPSDRGFLVMPLFHVHGLVAGLLAPLYAGTVVAAVYCTFRLYFAPSYTVLYMLLMAFLTAFSPPISFPSFFFPSDEQTYNTGGSVVIQTPRFSASEFWPQLLSTHCTWYTAVPTMHQILLQQVDKLTPEKQAEFKAYLASHSKLRFARSCSSALAPATYTSLESLLSVPVVEAYAMTEAAHQMTSNNLPPKARKAGSVGQAQGTVRCQIRSDDGKEVARGEEGEICVAGPTITKGYLNNEQANKESFFSDGYLRTGDRGRMDEEGFVFITGRLKEMINRGGEKIMPGEIDAVLLEHPMVAEAVAFAAPHPLLGQVPAAAVVLKPQFQQQLQQEKDKEKEKGRGHSSSTSSKAAAHQEVKSDETAIISSIQAFTRERLSAFKVPTVIYVAAALPRTATGKIQRRHVADHFLNNNSKDNSKDNKKDGKEKDKNKTKSASTGAAEKVTDVKGGDGGDRLQSKL